MVEKDSAQEGAGRDKKIVWDTEHGARGMTANSGVLLVFRAQSR